MKNWLLYVVAVATFGVGLAVGLLGQGFISARPTGDRELLRRELADSEIGCTGSNLIALGKIRSGDDEDAASFLETALSLNVVVLDEWRESHASEHRSEIDRMLRKVATYRSEDPFSGQEPAADENVARILSTVE